MILLGFQVVFLTVLVPQQFINVFQVNPFPSPDTGKLFGLPAKQLIHLPINLILFKNTLQPINKLLLFRYSPPDQQEQLNLLLLLQNILWVPDYLLVYLCGIFLYSVEWVHAKAHLVVAFLLELKLGLLLVEHHLDVGCFEVGGLKALLTCL